LSKHAEVGPIRCEYFAWRLFQRDGVFYADGRSNRPSTGKHSLNTRNRQEALSRLRELDLRKAAEIGRVKATSNPPTADLSISEGWSRFFAHCERPDVLGGVSAGTKKRYRAVRDKHMDFCAKEGIQHWAQVDQGHLERYGTNLKRKKYADRSLYLELVLLKSVIKWLIGKRLISESCRFSLSLRKPQGSDTYCYSRQQVSALVDHCRRNPELQWLGDIILVLALTGLRISELLGLRGRDIDLSTGTLHVADERSSAARQKLGEVRTTKGRRGRRLPIHQQLRRVLDRLVSQADGRLFVGPRGGKLKPDTVRRIFVREVINPLRGQFPTASGEIGFQHGRLHGFRHFFVSQAFEGGASEGEVKDWVGHRDSGMVELYRHRREEDSHRKMQQIDFLGVEAASNGSGRGKLVVSPIVSGDLENGGACREQE
jgi:integrase